MQLLARLIVPRPICSDAGTAQDPSDRIVTLWVVIDPIGTVPVFIAVIAGLMLTDIAAAFVLMPFASPNSRAMGMILASVAASFAPLQA